MQLARRGPGVRLRSGHHYSGLRVGEVVNPGLKLSEKFARGGESY